MTIQGNDAIRIPLLRLYETPAALSHHRRYPMFESHLPLTLLLDLGQQEYPAHALRS